MFCKPSRHFRVETRLRSIHLAHTTIECSHLGVTWPCTYVGKMWVLSSMHAWWCLCASRFAGSSKAGEQHYTKTRWLTLPSLPRSRGWVLRAHVKERFSLCNSVEMSSVLQTNIFQLHRIYALFEVHHSYPLSAEEPQMQHKSKWNLMPHRARIGRRGEKFAQQLREAPGSLCMRSDCDCVFPLMQEDEAGEKRRIAWATRDKAEPEVYRILLRRLNHAALRSSSNFLFRVNPNAFDFTSFWIIRAK